MKISNQANICFLLLGPHTHVQLEDLAEGLMILSLYGGFFFFFIPLYSSLLKLYFI